MCGILHSAARGNSTSDYYVEVHDNFSRARDSHGEKEKSTKKRKKKKLKVAGLPFGVKIIVMKGYGIRFTFETTGPLLFEKCMRI